MKLHYLVRINGNIWSIMMPSTFANQQSQLGPSTSSMLTYIHITRHVLGPLPSPPVYEKQQKSVRRSEQRLADSTANTTTRPVTRSTQKSISMRPFFVQFKPKPPSPNVSRIPWFRPCSCPIIISIFFLFNSNPLTAFGRLRARSRPSPATAECPTGYLFTATRERKIGFSCHHLLLRLPFWPSLVFNIVFLP